MTLLNFAPTKDFENLNDKLNRIFGEFPNVEFNFEKSFKPQVEISEDEKNLYLDLEIPGVKKDNINISLEENVLTIRGEKKNENESEKKDKKYLRSERCYGEFSRSFTLSSEINPDKIEAKFEDGVLSITLAKYEPETPKERTIEIK